MSDANMQQSADFWDQSTPSQGSRPPSDPVFDIGTSHAEASSGPGSIVAVFILAGIALLLALPFPPIGAILAIIGVVLAVRAMRSGDGNHKTALTAMIVAGVVVIANLAALGFWINGISSIFQSL